MSDKRVLRFYRTSTCEWEQREIYLQNPLPARHRKTLDKQMLNVCRGPLGMEDAITLLKDGMRGLEGKLWDNRRRASIDVRIKKSDKETTYTVLEYRRAK